MNKQISAILFALAFALVAFGQTTTTATAASAIPSAPSTPAAVQDTNIAALGVSYQPGGSPAVAGTGLYARQVSATSGTYAFSVLDAIPEAGVKPFTVTTGLALGIAQRVLTIGRVDIYIPLAAGFSYTGQNTGWNWSTGVLAVVPVKNTSWRVLPNFRAIKSSVGSASGYSLIFGGLFGWGWK